MSSVRKWITRVIAGLVGVLTITILAWVVVAGPATAWKLISHGDTKIDDFTDFPGRPLNPSASPLPFQIAEIEIPIPQEDLDALGASQDLDSILETNDTIAFLVIQDGKIRYERYFQGHSADSISQIFSVSKSVTSVLIGLAIDDGLIEGVDQPITGFIPELAEKGFSDVAIRNLLTMMSGTSYVENDNPFGEHVILNFTPNLEKRILEFKMETEPGTVFRYKSGDNALMGLALSRVLAPETITDYVQRRLWDPLGMEERGVWSTDHQDGGLEKTWCCLALSGRDLAKIGQLYLNGGEWHGQQILSADWIEQSTAVGQVPAAAWPEGERARGWRNYGYFWWQASIDDGDYFGLGKDAQFLYVNPATRTVIVRLGWSSGGLDYAQWVSLFQTVARSAGGQD